MTRIYAFLAKLKNIDFCLAFVIMLDLVVIDFA